MADLAFEDTTGNYYVVDIKTHNLTTSFIMPNLTSVERLARFYGDSKNYFVLLLVSYTIQDELLLFKECLYGISKITHRIDYFNNIREYWENQPD
jgi:hypothetical protein